MNFDLVAAFEAVAFAAAADVTRPVSNRVADEDN
jgi:hypothetical protein